MATSRKTSSTTTSGKESHSTSSRRSPGSGGQGEYFHVEVRPGEEFVTYRTQDVGDRKSVRARNLSPIVPRMWATRDISSVWPENGKPDRGRQSSG